jgi:hypothetical protein
MRGLFYYLSFHFAFEYAKTREKSSQKNSKLLTIGESSLSEKCSRSMSMIFQFNCCHFQLGLLFFNSKAFWISRANFQLTSNFPFFITFSLFFFAGKRAKEIFNLCLVHDNPTKSINSEFVVFCWGECEATFCSCTTRDIKQEPRNLFLFAAIKSKMITVCD